MAKAIKGMMTDRPEAAAAELVAELRRQSRTLALAESCTGGWAAKCITDVAGGSAVFECGLVTYSNASKMALLGVPGELLEAHGAVSREVVEAMARGALDASGADLAGAVSGIAGPGGGTPAKPVGTVWFGWAARGGECRSRMVRLDGGRDAVRRQSVVTLLRGLLDLSRAT